jgi:hypothetical protein
MELLPIWQTPLPFTLLETELHASRYAGALVAANGLAVAELVAIRSLRKSLEGRLAVHVGLEWIASLADALRRIHEPQPAKSPLSAYLADDLGLREPGVGSGALLLGHAQPRVPTSVLDSFVHEDEQRIVEFLEHQIQPWTRELLLAAKKGVQPSPTPEAPDVLLDRVRRYARPTFARWSSPTTTGWLFAFDDLHARVWHELFELHDQRPFLRICPLCARMFVPTKRGQTRCHRRLRIWETGAVIRECVGPRRLAAGMDAVARAEAQHELRREYKRREQALRRLRTRIGSESAGYSAALKEFAAWKAEHIRPRGRPGQDEYLKTDPRPTANGKER